MCFTKKCLYSASGIVTMELVNDCDFTKWGELCNEKELLGIMW